MEHKFKKFTFEREYSLSKKNIWRLLSDTNRVNLYIGLFPATFSSVKKRKNGSIYRLANGKAKGFIQISWEDYPFEWEKEKNSSVKRLYLTGPIEQYRGTVELLDSQDSLKTKVRLTAEFLPRNLAGLLAIPVVCHQNIQKKFDYLDQYISSDATELSSSPQKKKKYKVNTSELDRLLSTLRIWPVKEEHLDLLRTYLLEESVQDVAQINPVEIAKRWNINEDEALQLFLYATKTGLFNLSWNVICPNCRVSKENYTSLSELQAQFHCDLCGVNYDANFDQYVELTFSVHSSIRDAYAEIYCLGGPSITPHVLAQKLIEKGQTLTLAIPVPVEEVILQLRVLQANTVILFDFDKAACIENSIAYSNEGWSQFSMAPCSKVKIENTSSEDILLVLEERYYNRKAVTAARVTAMQEFRDLFTSEVLSPDQKIEINHVTILFTDLKESTRLYEHVGDAGAFSQVQDHFKYITQAITSNSGSVVKTIGDAVMAVFYQPEKGLKAILEIQQNLTSYNQDRKYDLILKAGLFSGPALVVNSNNHLDYFGRTVNIAAHIQGQSTGHDIIISQEIMDYPESAKLLSRNDIETEFFSTSLKGMKEDINLIRIRVKDNSIIKEHTS